MTRGEAMRSAREAVGLSIKALAEMTEIAYNTIQAMETNVRNPSIEIVELCADALGISIDEYVGHEIRRVDERKFIEWQKH